MAEASIIISLLTVVILSVNAFLLFRTFQMQESSESNKRAVTERQNLYQAITWFNSHRVELEIVFGLKGKPLIDWSPPEREAANTICWDLHFLGALLNEKQIPEKICELYYYAIPKSREVLDEYLEYVREKRHAQYWWKIEDLFCATRMHNKGTPYDLTEEFAQFYDAYDKPDKSIKPTTIN